MGHAACSAGSNLQTSVGLSDTMVLLSAAALMSEHMALFGMLS